jgi:Zn-finger nucleic acid-binding protein
MTPPLQCPRCVGLPMERMRTLRGELDCCKGCRGHWVGGPSLSQATAAVAEWVQRPRPPGSCAQRLHVLRPGQAVCSHCPQPRLRCPACTVLLTPVRVAGVAVDVCLECPGVWLDAGELITLTRAREGVPVLRESGVARRDGRVEVVDGALDLVDAVEAVIDTLRSLAD